jgi:hypothetical protein
MSAASCTESGGGEYCFRRTRKPSRMTGLLHSMSNLLHQVMLRSGYMEVGLFTPPEDIRTRYGKTTDSRSSRTSLRIGDVVKIRAFLTNCARKQNLQSSRGEKHPLLHTLIRSLQNRFPSIPMRMLLSASLISPIEFFPIALYLACGFSNPYSALKLILQGQRLGALCTTARQRIAILAIRRRHIDIQRSQGASASVPNFVRLILFNEQQRPGL